MLISGLIGMPLIVFFTPPPDVEYFPIVTEPVLSALPVKAFKPPLFNRQSISAATAFFTAVWVVAGNVSTPADNLPIVRLSMIALDASAYTAKSHGAFSFAVKSRYSASVI